MKFLKYNGWIVGAFCTVGVVAISFYQLMNEKYGLACFEFFMSGTLVANTFNIWMNERYMKLKEAEFRKLVEEVERMEAENMDSPGSSDV